MSNQVSMAAVARLVVQGSQVEAGEPQRIVSHYPGTAECTACGMPVEPYDLGALFGAVGKWAVVRMCYDGLDLTEVFAGRQSGRGAPCLAKAMKKDMDISAARDQYKGARMDRSGLCAAELNYPMEWLDDRMTDIPFPRDRVSEEDRAHRPMWRYVHGKSGTGTSAQLALAVRHYVELGKRCLFVTEPQMLASMMPDRNERGRSIAKKPEDFIGWDVLAIDKFGYWTSEFQGKCMTEIIEERARQYKPTLFGSIVPLDRGHGTHTTPCIENRNNGGGAIAGKIIMACGGWRGILHMAKDHRPMPDMVQPGRERQQRRDAIGRMPRSIGRVIDEPLDDPSPF